MPESTAAVVWTPESAWMAERDSIVAALAGRNLEIRSADGANRAAGKVREIRQLLKDLKAKRLEMTRPIEAAKKAIIAQEKELGAKLEEIQDGIRQSLGVWEQKQAAAARAAEAARRAAATKALAEVADDATDEEIAATVDCAMLDAPAAPVQKRVDRTHYRDVITYRVVDRGAIPPGFLAADPCDAALVKAHAKNQLKAGCSPDIPGLEIEVTKQPVVR